MPIGDPWPQVPVWPAPQGWMCPKCGSAHAPSVQTCPNAPAARPDCGCPLGTVCMNTACPRKPMCIATVTG